MDYSKMKKAQLIEEIEALQERVAELELAEAELKRAEELELAEAELKRAEEALRDREARLVKAQQVAHMGFLDWNLKTNGLFCSDEVYEVYGVSREEAPTSPEFVAKVVHPDDVEYVQRNLDLAVRGVKEYDIDHRIVRPDGEVLWVHAQAELARDADGNPETLFGTIVDITERVRAEEEIAGLAKFPSENPNPVLRVAKDGTIIYANEASLPLLHTWGCQVDQPLPDEWRKLHWDAFSSGISEDAEVEVEDRVLSLTFAPVMEAGYANVYGLDITERKRAEEMKDNLIRDVSHELKTPLAKMQMSVEQLMETVGTPSIDRQKVVRASEIVTGNVQRFQQTVDSILDLSSLESGRTLYHKTRVQLEKLIRQAMVDMQPLAEAKGLELAAELPDGLPQLEGDREKLLRVLTNLIDNSVKFSDQGKIVVSAEEKAHEVEIAVSDSGCGIPRENLDRVFERFWQENPTIPGAGIGLAICKTIVEAHGGKIWAESARRGQGATVRFTLPVVDD